MNMYGYEKGAYSAPLTIFWWFVLCGIEDNQDRFQILKTVTTSDVFQMIPVIFLFHHRNMSINSPNCYLMFYPLPELLIPRFGLGSLTSPVGL